MVFGYALAFLAIGANAASIASCGGDGDIVQDLMITMTPDPVKQGKTFKAEATWTFTEPVEAAMAVYDYTFAVMGQKLSGSGETPLNYKPGFAVGPQKLTIGPMMYPKLPMRVKPHLRAMIKLHDDAGKQIACLNVNMNLGEAAPVAEATTVQRRMQEMESFAPVADTPDLDLKLCGKDGDHFKIDTFDTRGALGITTVKGTLDEPVASGALDVTVNVRVLFISFPLKINMPFTYSPGVEAGMVDVQVGPTKETSLMINDQDASTFHHYGVEGVLGSVKGKIEIKDANMAPITCFAFSGSA